MVVDDWWMLWEISEDDWCAFCIVVIDFSVMLMNEWVKNWLKKMIEWKMLAVNERGWVRFEACECEFIGLEFLLETQMKFQMKFKL